MSDATNGRTRKRWGRRVLVSLGVVCAVLVLVVGLAGPRIAAGVAPWVVGRLDVPGRVELESVRLSWLGELRIERAAIYDAQGATVASVSVRTSGGLLGLIDGNIEQDAFIDGWAHLIIHEDGTTNVERALGLERGEEVDTEQAGELGRLPVLNLVLEGLDVAFSRAGSPTVGLVGIGGSVKTGGQQASADIRATLVLPPAPIATRADVSRGASHGSLAFDADVLLGDRSGVMSSKLEGLSSEAAAALGALTGVHEIERASAVAASDGLSLDLRASLQDGMPVSVTMAGRSATLVLDVALRQDNELIVLDGPGSITVDSAAFLQEPSLRRAMFPAEGVRVEDAGRLAITLEQLSLPAIDLASKWPQSAVKLRIDIGDAGLVVPGVQQESVAVRVEGAFVALETIGDGAVSLNATLDAGLEGQEAGNVRIEATGDLNRAMAREGRSTVAPGALAAIVPSASITFDGMPTVIARPWLGALAAAGVDVPSMVGPSMRAGITWAEEPSGAAVGVEIDAANIGIDVRARWQDDGLALTRPAYVRTSTPASLIRPWLPEQWELEEGGAVEVAIDQLTLPGDGFALRVSELEAQGIINASSITLVSPEAMTMGVQDLRAKLNADRRATTLELETTPTVGEHRLRATSSLTTDGLESLLQAEQPPAIVGSVELTGSTEAIEVLGIEVAEQPLQDWLQAGIGRDVRIVVSLTEPPAEAMLAGRVSLESEHATMRAEDLRFGSGALAVSAANITVTPTQQLWQRAAGFIDAPEARIVSTSPIVIDAGPATLDFASDSWVGGLTHTEVSVAAQGDLRVAGMPVGTPDAQGVRPTTEVVLGELAVSLNSLGVALSGGPGLRGSLAARIDDVDRGPIADVRGQLATNAQGEIDATMVLSELRAGTAASIAGLGERVASAMNGALGDGGTIELRASAASAAGEDRAWNLRRASIDVQTPRLTSAAPIVADFQPDAITLSDPVTVSWMPDETWLAEAIGARVTSARPFEIDLSRIDLGNPLRGRVGLLEPQAVFIDAAVRGEGAVVAIENRPDIDLQTLNARIRRTGLSTYSITADASTESGGTLELNSLLEKPTDEAGRLSLETAVLRGTLKGDDVPVSLADAMSNTDGLLADSLGPLVDLDVELSNARLVPRQPPSADIRFSVRGPRADASGYGRLENHIISMPQPQTILTVREVGPEITERFSQVIPELLLVEKRPEDGPAVIRTEGLAIPTNGQWIHGQGKATIALGTARFRTTSLLAGVLKATGQRAEGGIGRRIDPFEIFLVDGVITYEPFTLPLGDFSIESEGTVDLVQNEMNVIVWLPKAALTDEAAGRFNTGLGSALGRSVPGFGTVTTVPWRVSGPLDSPSIRPAPRVLFERRGDELLGPLLRPGQTIQDLLGIRGRSDKDDGGK